ncbi:LytTR family DNA-binding domain-containing protein [Pontixanthobacter sp. CEM42]|uniref:LytTR family transcriptional regulator DNA-binding domain-containing protein n=1 Tax=Pontixanthobacter sp. CEM42 TaxID=2792077 RepID=UPI001ADFBACC
MLAAYQNYPITLRLTALCFAAVALNAVYCLLYNYFAGNPETLFNAVAWGVINIVPWIAAVETARHFHKLRTVCCALTVAMIVSLAIELPIYGEYRTDLDFEIVRRLPGLAVSATVLGILALRTRENRTKSTTSDGHLQDFDWARAAGNYVELHRSNGPPVLVRSTLAALLESDASALCQIHRSYVVRRKSVARLDRQGVLLTNGKRLPVGNAYRNLLDFVPSSRRA